MTIENKSPVKESKKENLRQNMPIHKSIPQINYGAQEKAEKPIRMSLDDKPNNINTIKSKASRIIPRETQGNTSILTGQRILKD